MRHIQGVTSGLTQSPFAIVLDVDTDLHIARMKLLASTVLLALCAATVLASQADDTRRLHMLGPQGINLWKLDKLAQAQRGALNNDRGQARLDVEEFPAHWFHQPVDHFANGSETFGQRYWINTRHYKPRSGAPVIVIDGGETSGEDRLPFLDTGIADILAEATGGIGVILEHR